MKEPNLKDKVKELRRIINLAHLDQLERMLNASKGAGTTTALVEIAKKRNLLLITHTAQWAEQLKETHGIEALPFTSPVGGRTVLIDNGVNWLLLREAQRLRRLTEDLLNDLERLHLPALS